MADTAAEDGLYLTSYATAWVVMDDGMIYIEAETGTSGDGQESARAADLVEARKLVLEMGGDPAQFRIIREDDGIVVHGLVE